MAVHFARCCHPLPGDRIVGIITTGKGVTIHTIDCATLESFSESPERWIDVGWDTVGGSEGETAYTGRLKITVANQPGSLSSLSTVIARHGDRRRGRGREASRRHHGGAARHARHQRRRARAQLTQ
jgi:GTP pyrophosphokinase